MIASARRGDKAPARLPSPPQRTERTIGIARATPAAPHTRGSTPLPFRAAAIVTVALLAAATGVAMAAPEYLPLDITPEEWEFTAQGRYLRIDDPRQLCQIFHPWAVAADGDFGALASRVEVPAGWRGPLYLSFYASDTYVADGWEQVRPTWTHAYAACHHLPGHRFKQVLVDGRVVWERDVADAEEDSYYSCQLLRACAAGQCFELMLRVIDRVGSGTSLPTDEFRLGIWSWQGLADPQAARKFYTRVFWGDLALSPGGPLARAQNPSRGRLALRPPDPGVPAVVGRGEGRLTLSAPGGLPAAGYPVTWGIPFGRGRLRDAAHLCLLAPDGSSLPLQTTVLQRWPDGSLRWVLLDFCAPAGTADSAYTVLYGTQVQPAAAAPGLRVAATDSTVTVDTGALCFTMRRGTAALLEDVVLAGEREPLGHALAGELVTRDGWQRQHFVAVAESLAVEATGPERATVRASGHLRDGERCFGRFSCRVHAYRGRSFLRLFYRVFNDTEAPAQLVEEMVLRLRTALVRGEAVLQDQRLATGPAESDRLLVRQHAADGYEVFAGDDSRRSSGRHWCGPVTLQGPDAGVSGQVRHFAQQYPKRQWAGCGGQLVFDLFARTEGHEQYVMTRGEAKRHELLLDFHAGEPDPALFAAFEAPPILLSPEWYAEQQALGRGAPLTSAAFPGLCPHMLEKAVPDLTCTVPLGLRNWPDGYSDSVYNAYRGTWSNMYQEVDYGAHLLALLGGARAWFDYAAAYQHHFMDLDICHYHSDPTWVGASYGIAPYHTGSEPAALNAPLAGLFLLHYLTGDPDAREAAVGIADWLHARHTGVGAGSGRAVGWPLRSAAIAYENTGDEKHLQTARRLAEYALASLEPRRLFFSEPPATWHYRGGSPGMNAILAAGLMRYWRLTGDERTGQACAAMACNMAYAWMSPTEPGLILGADPLQQVHVAGYALQDVLPLFWGYELTGDERFLEKGAQVMAASVLAPEQKGAAFGLSRYWEMQDILYYYGIWLARTDSSSSRD